MRVQITEPRPIPAGWTYKRCDRFTKGEFMDMYRNDEGKIGPTCAEYIMSNPKDYYTVDDKIAIRQIKQQREVNSMYALTGNNTTKRYAYDHDCGGFKHG